jgi:hypothetical protein
LEGAEYLPLLVEPIKLSRRRPPPAMDIKTGWTNFTWRKLGL